MAENPQIVDTSSEKKPKRNWSPSPIVWLLRPGTLPSCADLPFTAAEELLYSDIRIHMDGIWERLGSQQAFGLLSLKIETTMAKGPIPGAVLPLVLKECETHVAELVSENHKEVSWQHASDGGRYDFRMAWTISESPPSWTQVAKTKLSAPQFMLAPGDTACQVTPNPNKPDEGCLSHVVKSIQEFIGSLPLEPEARLQGIAELYSELRKQLTPILRSTITDRLQGSESLSYDEKSNLAQEINQVLTDARLAIRDPGTKLPAMLLAQRPRVSVRTSYLRIQDSHKAGDGKRHYFKVEDLKQGENALDLIDVSRGEPTIEHG